MSLHVYDEERKEFIYDTDKLMRLAGLDPRMGFESIAIQPGRTIIILDACGNYGYLPDKYEALAAGFDNDYVWPDDCMPEYAEKA